MALTTLLREYKDKSLPVSAPWPIVFIFSCFLPVFLFLTLFKSCHIFNFVSCFLHFPLCHVKVSKKQPCLHNYDFQCLSNGGMLQQGYNALS